jgi:hypothetical protein
LYIPANIVSSAAISAPGLPSKILNYLEMIIVSFKMFKILEGNPGAEIAALDTILAGMYNKEGKESMYLVV